MALKDIFGEPGTGIHSFRIANIAVVDTAMTVIAAWFLARWIHQPFLLVLLVLFIIGELVHVALGVDTTVKKAID
jgi:succinate dehydrogenase hydrophobic anchor subunit